MIGPEHQPGPYYEWRYRWRRHRTICLVRGLCNSHLSLRRCSSTRRARAWSRRAWQRLFFSPSVLQMATARTRAFTAGPPPKSVQVQCLIVVPDLSDESITYQLPMTSHSVCTTVCAVVASPFWCTMHERFRSYTLRGLHTRTRSSDGVRRDS